MTAITKEQYNQIAATEEFLEPMVTGAGWTQYVVRREIKRMLLILGHGLHPVYADFEDFLCDYYPDFRWPPKQFILDMQALLASPEWVNLAVWVKEKYGYDFVAKVKAAIEECESEE